MRLLPFSCIIMNHCLFVGVHCVFSQLGVAFVLGDSATVVLGVSPDQGECKQLPTGERFEPYFYILSFENPS